MERHPVVAVGWFFWVHLIYADAPLLAAPGVFVVSLARVSRLYWREAAALIAAALVPWLVNLPYNLNIAGLGRVDWREDHQPSSWLRRSTRPRRCCRIRFSCLILRL
jgi:hypothetical protein